VKLLTRIEALEARLAGLIAELDAVKAGGRKR
jgi:hypothetical protein